MGKKGMQINKLEMIRQFIYVLGMHQKSSKYLLLKIN
jgi:hypothetical protein